MSKLYVNNIVEANAGAGVHVPGHVIQTVFKTSGTVVTTSSASMQSFGLSQSFTPLYSTSKILIMAELGAECYGYSDLGISFELFEDSTQLFYRAYNLYLSADSSQRISPVNFIWYGNASSTSARTYEFKFRPSNTSGTARMNNYGGSDMIIQEIAQ